MKVLKIIVTGIATIVVSVIILFLNYTSFVDDVDIEAASDSDFTRPSRFVIKYEVFVSGTLMRPSYRAFVNRMNIAGSEKILDFGSGSGGEAILIADALNNRSGSLTCLDISPTWLNVVRQRLADYRNIEFLEGDITAMDIPEGSFDAIAVRLVLHDIPEGLRKKIVGRFFRILKPGGTVYLHEPVSGSQAIDEMTLRSMFVECGFRENYFRKEFGFTMIPPRTMAVAAYKK